jgi:hypothetical protein
MQVYNARHHTLILLKDFLAFLQQGFPSDSQAPTSDEETFKEQLQALINALESDSLQATYDGQDWLTRLFRNFPNLAPRMGREVLWYFGGDALHFMPDEEISKFQQLEDAMQEGGEGFDYLAAKKAIFQSS